MGKNLVIVESPAKAKTIGKFLGDDYIVESSYGHIRDLSKKKLGVDVESNYAPVYIVSDDKQKVVDALKRAVKKAGTVWLASDEDREGEAIAWHLMEVLKLKPETTKRIVFHEITENAILEAIKNPRDIDINLVHSQQARRILDRMVGFELSPILWKKVKPSLSAGRVQSVAVRLIVEREREVIAFKPTSYYRVNAIFDGKTKLKAELSDKLNKQNEALFLVQSCADAKFSVSAVTKKPAKKVPQPPFTTSTMQQEAGRKLNMSVSQTMQVAQRLYESGLITYMRTDSVNLSEMAIGAAKGVITELYGKKYHQARRYKTKSKGAQEAHEAIRPTYLNRQTISGTSAEQRLYKLIWERTIASQMADAQIERTNIDIDISTSTYKFVASGEVVIFDGFLKVYMESSDNEQDTVTHENLPNVSVGQELQPIEIVAMERFTMHPPRYTEASLVKKMEELGIGRPSTYAPTITTITSRGYVNKEDREGTERQYDVITLKNGNLKQSTKLETSGGEKAKLVPGDIGMVVTDFLMEYFQEIMNFDFTANVEKEFDSIAEGKMEWTKMIDKFYRPFHALVEKTTAESNYTKGERVLGKDPVSGQTISVRIGRFGPLVQMGESDTKNNVKPRFASLLKGQLIETITLDEALELFKLPRTLGNYEDKTVVIGVGRFGPYVRHDSKFVSLPKTDDPLTVNLQRAIELIEEGRKKARERTIKVFETEGIQILNGRWGPYLNCNGINYKIDKNTNAADLTLADCKKIIASQPDAKPRRGSAAARALQKAELEKFKQAKKAEATKKSTAKTAATAKKTTAATTTKKTAAKSTAKSTTAAKTSAKATSTKKASTTKTTAKTTATKSATGKTTATKKTTSKK